MSGAKAKKKAQQAGASTESAGVGGATGYLPHALVAAVALALALYLYRPYRRGCVTCPLAAAKLKLLPQFSQEHKDALLWGNYRPGLYMGMRTRLPKSLQFGMMWFDPDSPETITQRRLRHKASQDDKLQSYGWLHHDGCSYGHQSLVDQPFNISIHMVKEAREGSARGGDWALRVHATHAAGGAAQAGARQRLSLLLYVWDEQQPASSLTALPQGKKAGQLHDGAVVLEGGNADLGPWQLLAKQGGGVGAPKVQVNYLAAEVEGKQAAVQLEALTLDALLQTARQKQGLHLYLPDAVLPGANLAMVQLSFRLPATFDVVFLSAPHHPSAPVRIQQLTGDPLGQMIRLRQQEFDRRFDQEFLGGRQLEADTRRVAQAALSNLVGGMGYFYGASTVMLPAKGNKPAQEVQYWLEELYTAVPSRSFFPRGFLWDEGFHHLLLRRWDPQLARDALAHWLDLLNSYGWIPREQILGDEAKARVPAEFVAQHPNHANPPSLLLLIMQMASALSASRKAEGSKGLVGPDEEFLQAAWPRLEVWYKWYNSTQQGPLPGSFRWHGRDADTVKELNPKTLTSGLDDYPRASHPTGEERHLDLLCWMALASQAMATIGEALGLPRGVVGPYRAAATRLADPAHLEALHWDSARGVFADWGLHTEDVRLEKVVGPGQESQTVRVVGISPTPQYVPHYGYVSLFPLLMRLIPPTSPILLQQLDRLADPSLLWTPYGIRSLAPTSTMYMVHNTPHDRPYWRGPIWININFLAASSLHHYCEEGIEKACELYMQLRRNVLRNLVGQYSQTGYLWEQYKDGDGGGLGSHPFTGWTALVALVAAEAY